MDIKDLVNFVKFTEKCSQKEVAMALGIAECVMSDVLKGRRNPNTVISKLLEKYPYLSKEFTNNNKDTLPQQSTNINTDERTKLLNLLTNQQQIIMDLQAQIKEKDKLIAQLINQNK